MRKSLLTSFLLIGIFILGAETLAQEGSNDGLVPGNLRSVCVPSSSSVVTGDNLTACINGLYKFGVSGVAILAVSVIIWGGFVWMTSGGNVSRIESAKEWIYGAVFGLILALASFLLLNTINPQLIRIDQLSVPPPAAINKEDLVKKVRCRVTNTSTGSGVPANIDIAVGIAGEDCSGLIRPGQTATPISIIEAHRTIPPGGTCDTNINCAQPCQVVSGSVQIYHCTPTKVCGPFPGITFSVPNTTLTQYCPNL